MLKLRLAEYKDGKFERFLELGSDFGNFFYCGDCIGIWNESETIKNGAHYFQDKKDPLNRFDGLFDGRTYGEGRFVLIKDGQFDIYETTYFASLKGEKYYSFRKKTDGISCQLIGNLIENPELFSKI